MFEPWVGARWKQPGELTKGVRLMVLGESHYADVNDTHLIGTCIPGMTKYAVERWALNETHQFFTNVTQLVSGQPKSDLTSEPGALRRAWDSILFYNYIPVFVATRPGVPPTPEMFRLGRDPFLRVVDEYKPEAILVCGHRLWGWVLGDPGGSRDNPATTPFYTIAGAVAARMKHSSRAFNWSNERQHILEELTKASIGSKQQMSQKSPDNGWDAAAVVLAAEDAATRFHRWMTKYNHPGYVSDRHSALQWLHHDSGHLLVGDDYHLFRAFCEKAVAHGHRTMPPPTKAEFDAHMREVSRRQNQEV